MRAASTPWLAVGPVVGELVALVVVEEEETMRRAASRATSGS